MEKLSEHDKIMLLGATALVLGVVFVVFFYGEEIVGLNFSLFYPLVALLGILLSRVFSRSMDREQYALLLLGIFFSFMIFVRSSELLTFFNFLGSLLLLLIVVYTFTGKRIRSFMTSEYLRIPFLPFRFIGPFFQTFPAIVSFEGFFGKSARTKEIIRGSLMGTFAVLVFGLLFSSADAGFEKLLSYFSIFDIDQDLINRIILGAIATAFFIGGFGFMFKKIHPSPAPLAPEGARNLGAIETMILLGSINALFLVFIILQVSYLFGGAEHLLKEGLTYAEYAREGFFQLVIVAVLSFLIIAFAERQIIRDAGAHLRSFKVLSGALVLQVIAILLSAFSRLSLYESAYGFTTIRLFSHAFMIWLAIALIILVVHIRKNDRPENFSFRIFCTIVILLFSMNMLNPDVFIAKVNLARYQSTGLIDATYLGSLSGDALPYTIHLLDDPNEDVRRSFARQLYYLRHNYCGLDDCEDARRDDSWQALRWNTKRTDALLAPREKFLAENRFWEKTGQVVPQ